MEISVTISDESSRDDHMIIILESVSICLGTVPRENILNQPWPRQKGRIRSSDFDFRVKILTHFMVSEKCF